MARASMTSGTKVRRLLPAEGNIEDQPFFVLSSGRAPGEGTIVRLWESRFVDGKGEERVRRHRWEVRESKGLGLPGQMEQDVYVALLELLEKRGGIPEDGKVGFTLYELLNIMGWPHDGERYRRLRRALRCISSTTIDSRRAFYSKRLNRHITDNFQLFSVHFGHAEDEEGNRIFERTHVIFHPYYRESYEEDYLGRLDASFYWSLRHHTSKRLYRLLDRLAPEREDAKTRSCEIDLFDLSDRLPLGNYRYPSQVKEKLAAAHEELKEKGFLRSVTFREHKEGRRKLVLARYRLSKEFSARTFTKAIDLTEDQRDAVEQLVGWRVDRRVAEEKVLLMGADHCRRWAELLHFQEGVELRRAPNLLIWALKEEPEEWEERAERKRRILRESPASAAPTNGGGGPATTAPTGLPDGAGRGGRAIYAPDPVPDPGAARVWDAVLEDLAEEIDAPSWKVWFEGTVPVSLSGAALTVSVPNSFALQYITERFRNALQEALEVRLSHHASLRIVVAGAPIEPGEADRSPASPDSSDEGVHPGDVLDSADDDPREVWRGLVTELLDERPVAEPSWFDPYLGYALEDKELVVSAPNEGAVSLIIERFGDDFDRLWKRRAGADARIVVGQRGLEGEGVNR